MLRFLVPSGSVWILSVLLLMPGAPARLVAGQPAAAQHPGIALFSHSQDCVGCHNNLVGPTGDDVSIGASWRSTMMANAARDPYWQASVRRETTDHPMHSADIQDECAACHMPMARQMARAAGGRGEVFAHLPVAGDDSPLHRLAADSVSCAVCHQISNERLGTAAGFNGEFALTPNPPGGPRRILGPHQVDAGRQAIMRSVTGFEQTEAPHIRQSALCASCHTLTTRAFGPDGAVVGTLPEQMNFQEWQHSDFVREQRSCQSCHMPAAAGPIRNASVLGDSRDYLSRHLFVGGNAYMVRMLSRFRRELGVEALPSELEATATATIRQLQQETATLTVSSLQRSAGSLAFDVTIRTLVGHKYPSGYPSRRTWLHVTVTDAQGRVVFESGAIDTAGAIQGNDNDSDPTTFEPHFEQVTRADQVQIYETILGDPAGVPTTGLLAATQYLKDNRLLPRGFDKATADPEVAVHGEAADDADFAGAGDRVRYLVPFPAVERTEALNVVVELRYQPIGYRWARNLQNYDAAEAKRFVAYNTAMSAASSVVVATATGRLDP